MIGDDARSWSYLPPAAKRGDGSREWTRLERGDDDDGIGEVGIVEGAVEGSAIFRPGDA